MFASEMRNLAGLRRRPRRLRAFWNHDASSAASRRTSRCRGMSQRRARIARVINNQGGATKHLVAEAASAAAALIKTSCVLSNRTVRASPKKDRTCYFDPIAYTERFCYTSSVTSRAIHARPILRSRNPSPLPGSCCLEICTALVKVVQTFLSASLLPAVVARPSVRRPQLVGSNF